MFFGEPSRPATTIAPTAWVPWMCELSYVSMRLGGSSRLKVLAMPQASWIGRRFLPIAAPRLVAHCRGRVPPIDVFRRAVGFATQSYGRPGWKGLLATASDCPLGGTAKRLLAACGFHRIGPQRLPILRILPGFYQRADNRRGCPNFGARGRRRLECRIGQPLGGWRIYRPPRGFARSYRLAIESGEGRYAIAQQGGAFKIQIL